MLQTIFLIAESRNKAVHGDPYIANAKEVITKAKIVLKILKKMYSKKYLLFTWGANTLMLITLFATCMAFAQHFPLGKAIFFTLITYYLHFLLMQKVGYKNYIFIIFAILIFLFILGEFK